MAAEMTVDHDGFADSVAARGKRRNVNSILTG